jgi:hypothetical protein
MTMPVAVKIHTTPTQFACKKSLQMLHHWNIGYNSFDLSPESFFASGTILANAPGFY